MSLQTGSMDNTTTLNLKRLLLLRSIAIACELLGLLLASQWLQMSFPLLPMLLVIGLHAVINVITWLRLKHARQVYAPEFALQLALDTLVLALLLFFSGGYTNPFVSLFMVPLLITASILPKKYTWFMALLTVGCYTILMFYYMPLAQPQMHSMQHESEFGLHVLGMWFSFLLSAGLVVFFMVRMSNSLRERDQALAKAREKALHDEHLVALGTLATGAAHELGTPLATMAVLANEMKYDHADDPDVIEKAEIFRSQLERCKAIISEISASAGQARGEGGGSVAIDAYLHQVVKQWQIVRPQAQLTLELHGITPAPHILADKTLTQAIINVLNNAADASLDHVEIAAHWDKQQLTIDVLDQGPGLHEAVIGAVGTPFFTTKPEGHGLGLYLARGVMSRYNGTLELSNRSPRGAQARLTLPLTALEI